MPSPVQSRLHLFAPAIALLASLLCLAPAAAEPATVARHVDGDTIWLDMGNVSTKVRVAGLDTPEIGDHAKCDAERVKGDAASAFAKQLMPVGKVVDVQPTGRREKWGRLLAHITVDGRDYAAMVIERGLGVYYDGGRKQDFCGVGK